MRRLLALAILVATSACWQSRSAVPVEVDWTFGGKSCADAGVASIQIDVDNEVLTPNKFTCVEASQGADLGEFLAGPYTATVTGFDSSDNIIFQTTQVLQVRNGVKNVIPIDAAPTTGTTTLRWSFAGKTCDAAQVPTVRVSVDDQVITDAKGSPDLPCKGKASDGSVVEGTTIGPLSPGSHTFALAARGNASDYSAANLNAQVVAGRDTPAAVDLAIAQPTTASADVRWNFQPGGKSCAEVGIDHLYVYFDPPASGSWGTPIADTPCAGLGGAPVTEIQIVDVPDGSHSFAIRGTRSNQILYYTHHPVSTIFGAPFTSAVDVTAEPQP